jgi:sucrose phosphorylase
LESIDLLLFYATKGADLIRLDAISYLWKEIGTSCLHLPQTHAVIKIWRSVFDLVAPWVVLITETNVPHEENISYFGNSVPGPGITDEAQMVYQFALAPLVLHTFQKSDVTKLNRWAEELEVPAPFFNFIASHDGIGVMPAKGILSEIEIQELVDRTIDHGGQVSFRSNPDGSESVYELNITLYDWLNKPGDEPEQVNIDRFLASQFIMLSLAGVPGIYFHSLIGSNNCYSCFKETGRARSLNREKLDYLSLNNQLKNPESKCSKILVGYCQMLRQRRSTKAFNPFTEQQVLNINKEVFGLLRKDIEGKESVLCLANVSKITQEVIIDFENAGIINLRQGIDMLSGEIVFVNDNNIVVELSPFKTMWIKFQVE